MTAMVRPGSTSRATAVSANSEQQAGDQRAEHIADAAHDDDDQRLHGEDHAHCRAERQEHADQDAARADNGAAAAKASAEAACMSMPDSRAASGLTAMARSAVP